MQSHAHCFTATLWLYPGPAAWYFVTIPKPLGQTIKAEQKQPRRGWGSVPVTVTIVDFTWSTSIFPDTSSGSYLLPIKASVRNQAGIMDGDSVAVTLTL